MAVATSAGVVRRPLGFLARAPLIRFSLPGILRSAGRVGHAGANRVGGDPERRQLVGELPDVGLQGRLGGGDRPVGGPDMGPARAGHGEDPAAGAHQLPPDQILCPVHQAVGHHVQGHLDLGLADGVLGVLGDIRPKRAKRQGVQEDGHGLRLAALRQETRHLVEDLLALLRVRGVHVEEDGLAAQAADLVHDPFHVSERGLAVHVHAEDVQAVLGERAARGLAEPAGGAENQSPPVKHSQLCAHFRCPPGRQRPAHTDARGHSTWRGGRNATGMPGRPFRALAKSDRLIVSHDGGKLSGTELASFHPGSAVRLLAAFCLSRRDRAKYVNRPGL